MRWHLATLGETVREGHSVPAFRLFLPALAPRLGVLTTRLLGRGIAPSRVLEHNGAYEVWILGCRERDVPSVHRVPADDRTIQIQPKVAGTLNQVPIIFSEDFSEESIVEGVRFVNPFSPDFVAEPWIQ